jgi:hypothetical protein
MAKPPSQHLYYSKKPQPLSIENSAGLSVFFLKSPHQNPAATANNKVYQQNSAKFWGFAV